MENPNPAKIGFKIFESAKGSDENLTPVIFLHGILCSKEMWLNIPQIVADETRRKVYACDARNHGESEFTDAFNFDLNVVDFLNFMDQLKIFKAILVGHSMGGLTAIHTALRKPDRVEKVFSVDMYVKKIDKELSVELQEFTNNWTNIIRNLPKDTPESKALETSINKVFEMIPKDSHIQLEKDSMMKSNLILKRKPDGSYDVPYNHDAIVKASQNPDTLTSEPVGLFQGLAYFIYGTLSQLKVAAEEENIKKHFPAAQLIKFEGATHNVHVDFPDKFVQTLLNYL